MCFWKVDSEYRKGKKNSSRWQPVHLTPQPPEKVSNSLIPMLAFNVSFSVISSPNIQIQPIGICLSPDLFPMYNIIPTIYAL